ncbi:CLUMA_CG005239, isoform A [Clunio marinus]|uniref:CLUMA_CG005239, isoform A n=1 Tax=Clunio marinus TaxID=568069 RepID=A0A1J1HZM4_9DIPT|nr:CLUMA_CG005239, isoform A [Clunio marinus]
MNKKKICHKKKKIRKEKVSSVSQTRK